MENELLGIGRLASLSGLTVSALRFYDGAQVLRPARVDPTSGYRWYRPEQVVQARLVAHLRRVGLPLDDIRAVLAEPARAPAILATHLSRLEAGLADARREIFTVHRLLENQEITMTRFTLPAADFARALAEVRYAVSTDPELPMLNGVFLDSERGRLRLVATDRYRLATSTVATAEPVTVQVLLPTAAVDDLLDGAHEGDLDVVVADGTITISGSGGTVTAPIPDVEFPPYRTWLDLGRNEIPIRALALRTALRDAPTETRRHDSGVAYEVSRLSVTGNGVEVGPSEDPTAVIVGVNREFLLQALDAGDQLTLGLDGPITPLAIRNPDRDGTLSILMPVRLDVPA